MPRCAGDDRLRVRLERRQRLAVDDRADVGREQRRVADRERVHDARQQLEHARRDILLDEQHAQRRAALARALEGRGDHVAHRLLGQGGDDTLAGLGGDDTLLGGQGADRENAEAGRQGPRTLKRCHYLVSPLGLSCSR